MKKELVIVVGSCYPVSSAKGTFALRCAEYLKDYYNIRIISIQEEGKKNGDMQLGDFKLYFLTQWRERWKQLSRKKELESLGIKKKIFHLSYQLARIAGRFECTFFTLDSYSWYANKSYELLNKLNQENKIDAVLTFNSPIQSHQAACRFKSENPHVKWISYWTDYFSTKVSTHNIFWSVNKLSALEEKLLLRSDKVLCTDEIYNSLIPKYDTSITNKIKSIPYYLKRTRTSLRF